MEDALKNLRPDPLIDAVEPNHTRSLNAIPAEPMFGQQWSLSNSAQVVNGRRGPADIDIVEYESTPFTYLNGTSFSAPIVSGIAALLWSQKPELPHLWVRAVLLAANKNNSLEGLVASGGPISAATALDIILADYDEDGQDNGDEFILGTNFLNSDSDSDGVGDSTDALPLDSTRSVAITDADNDGITDSSDNCPSVSNENQADADGDGIGDTCQCRLCHHLALRCCKTTRLQS